MADATGTPGLVVSDEDYRLNQAGLIAPKTSTLAVRTGAMWGPGATAIVTGTSTTGTMTVNVAPHHWVSTRATSDGVYLGTKEATTTVNIAAAPGSNSRIDVVWSKQNDANSTVSPDGSTAESYGVTTGTAAASPTKPVIPVGATEIATVQIAAGTTNTLGAGATITNTAALTVARGADIPVRNQAERDALTTFPFLTVKRLDTGKIEARNVGDTAWVTVFDPAAATTLTNPIRYRNGDYGAGIAITAGGSAETGVTAGAAGFASITLASARRLALIGQFRIGTTGAATASLKINGAVVGYPSVNRVNDQVVTTQAIVDLAAGTHSIAARVDASSGSATWVHVFVTIHEGIAGA